MSNQAKVSDYTIPTRSLETSFTQAVSELHTQGGGQLELLPSVIAISAAFTVPSDVILNFPRGGSLQPASTITVNIASNYVFCEDGNSSPFGGAGTVTGAANGDPIVINPTELFQVVLKNGTTSTVGGLLGYSSGWTHGDADAQVAPEWMALEAVIGNGTLTCRVARAGMLFDSDAPYTAGANEYLSATAGAITETIPALSTTLTIVRKVGVALSTSVIAFNLHRMGPEHMRIRAAVDPASANTDTVQNLAVTLTGVLATDCVQLFSAPAVVQGVIYNGSLVAGSGNVTMGIANASAGTVDGASTNVDFLILRY